MNMVASDVLGYVFAGLVGFSLAAACGMLIFAPLAILSAAVHFGWLSPGDKLAWIGSMPALVCFSIACVIEALGMMIPWVDHLLDIAGAPVAALAGTLVIVTQLASAAGVDTSLVPAWVTWALAAVVGGGVATGVHAATGTLRAGSTTVSGGLLNPFFALGDRVVVRVVRVGRCAADCGGDHCVRDCGRLAGGGGIRVAEAQARTSSAAKKFGVIDRFGGAAG